MLHTQDLSSNVKKELVMTFWFFQIFNVGLIFVDSMQTFRVLVLIHTSAVQNVLSKQIINYLTCLDIHFQYNGFLFGILLLSLYYIYRVC